MINLIFKSKKQQTDKSEEEGMALILTLGVLTIIIVLAMGFVASSITTQKAAVYENNATVAKMLADSAVQRAIGAMRFYSTMSLFYDEVQSHDETDPISANRKNFDFLYRLATAVDSAEYEWPSPYNPNASDAVHWEYVYNGLSGGDKRIIGRIAYITVNSEGRLDPSTCVEHGGSAVNENGANEVRNGVDVNEINIQNLDPTNSTTYLSTTNVSNFSSTSASPPGKLTDGMRWPDWETLFSSSRLNITDNNHKDQYRAWFALDAPADAEAFWIDSDADKVEDTGEFYHRFNLARTDWDSLTVANIVAAPTVYSTSPSTHNGTGLKWINNWTEVGTYTDLTARKNQLAANLIDFADSDSIPTTDSTTDPTYMGLEKTPYINELGIQLQGTVTMTNIPGPTKMAHMDYGIRAGGEIINMYGENFSAATTLTIEGAIYMTMRAESGQTDNPGWIPFSAMVNLTPIGANQYKFTWGNQTAFYSWSAEIGPPHKVWCEDVKCRITKATLTYNGNIVDVVKPDAASGESTSLNQLIVRDNNGTDSMYFDYEANDPRQNLNDQDWAQGGNSAKNGPYGGTNEAVNSSIDCTTVGDAESGSTPCTQSTAFIRNAPFQSPWELGMIHRGANWETINLKAYNDSDSNYGVATASGGGTYANGDANILDEIKMTPNVETYGKVNINSTNLRVLRALLAGIRYGIIFPNDGPDGSNGTADDDSPGDTNSGTVLDYNSDVTNLAAAIEGSTGRPFATRAHVAKVSELFNGSEITQSDDALKEEIIGKFINLTKKGTSSDTITIIALAQSIRDIGNGITIYKDLDQDGTIGTADETTFEEDINGDGDTSDTSIPETISNCTFGTYDQYADEIMAEQKVMATVYRDPTTGKWRIIRFEYLED